MAAVLSSLPTVDIVNGAGKHQQQQQQAMNVVDSFDRVDSVMRDDGDGTVPNLLLKPSVTTTTATTTITPQEQQPPVTSTIPKTALRSTINNTAAPAANTEGVRILGLAEWKEAAMCLAEAFAEDDMAMYFLDTPDRAHWSREQKWALHVKIMEYVTYAHLLKGLVVCAGPGYDCVALWMPPGKNMDDLLTIFRSGMWRLNYELSTEGKKRFFTEFLPLLHDTKAQVLGDRDPSSWYLVYIGTKPSARGKGYARKVIDHVTRLADREGRACYLESSNEVNRKIYGRMGFVLQKNIFLQRAESHVELDIMVREAERPVAVGGK